MTKIGQWRRKSLWYNVIEQIERRFMAFEFIAAATALLAAFVSVMGIVSKVGRVLASLEEAVKQLKQFMESQSKKNSGFLKQIVEQERRIALLESCVFTKQKGGGI